MRYVVPSEAMRAAAVACEVERFGSVNAAALRVLLPSMSPEEIAASVLVLASARLVEVGFDGVVTWKGVR